VMLFRQVLASRWSLLIRQQRLSRISASASTSYLCVRARLHRRGASQRAPPARGNGGWGVTVGASTNEESAARPEMPNLAAVKLLAVSPHQPAELDDCPTISSDSRVPLLRAWACRCVTTPDGYTLLQVNSGNAVNASLYANLNFNFIRDITAVACIARTPFVMVVNPSSPAKTVPEFIAYAKAPIFMTSAEFGKFIADKTEKWGKVVKFTGIKADWA
jgi:hypothetical protein